MLLIFGGTTEGRLAVEVCEQAGTPFYYSTKGERQDVEMHNGVRLTGAMSADEISTFCQEHNIQCIIDAAHPFAENLHNSIHKALHFARLQKRIMHNSQIMIPVIRLERHYEEHREGVIYCKGYDETLRTLEEHHPKCLLALSGANTISKLKLYWSKHKTLFRILQRPESIEIALRNGFPTSNLIFYNEGMQRCPEPVEGIPSVESEMELFSQVGCDAIITKESGETGGFKEKVDAALQLGLKVFVIEHPDLPSQWIKVTGKYTLRRAIEHVVPEFFPLKTGLTTGACATAAAKAAAISLLTGECPEEVSFALPGGEVLTIPVNCTEAGTATVTKDWSDDPDVLRGCKITAGVRTNNNGEINFLQGEGVGRVTLPGLGIPVGGPAVNSTPRKMIFEELQQLATEVGFDVTISVENGRELAKKTFNHKVGVVDGISIIGTSGIVSPLSNEAFIHSIHRELEVAKAIGCKEIGLVAGMKSENGLKSKVKGLRCVHYGNFIGESLKAAYELGFESVILAIMIGKAVKLAEGHLDTHSHKVAMNKEFLKSMAPEEYAAQIDSMTMARELWDFMPQEFFNQIEDLCYRHCRTVFPKGELNIRLFKM